MISIGALVYASPRYAEHLWENVRATTQELEKGEAEFYFVANDPTPEVVAYLERAGIPHFVQQNERLTRQQLERIGIGKPEYIRRVYQGWNRLIREAREDCLVMLASDHVLRPGWLTALRERWAPALALSPLTVEPSGKHGVFSARLGRGTGAVHGEHGKTLAEFDAAGFERHALELTADRYSPGGAHMPVMVSVAKLVEAGLFPEGNLHAGSFDRVADYGDRVLFRKLESLGVRHVTYHGVVAYHFQEGEMREAQ